MQKYNSLEPSIDKVNEKNTIQIKQIKRNILEEPVTREQVMIILQLRNCDSDTVKRIIILTRRK